MSVVFLVALFVLGVSMVSAGLFLVSVPLALIVMGCVCAGSALFVQVGDR